MIERINWNPPDWLIYTATVAIIVGAIMYLVGLPAQADQPHQSCECRELTRIRLLLEHQFGVVCDERHCEGQSSSGQGGSLP